MADEITTTVTGNGTVNDPYVCYSWEDFESLGNKFIIDHKPTNIITPITPEPTGDVPQLKPNIYIKFADYKDPEDPDKPGVDVKEVDFQNQCIPNSIIFKNIAQIDFNGWIFKNIGVSYYHTTRIIDVTNDTEIEKIELCVGNTIIIQNTISDEQQEIFPVDYIKILNGKFIFNENWNYLESLDSDITEDNIRRIETYDIIYKSSDETRIKDEIDNFENGGVGFNLYNRDFPLFFFNTYPRFFRVYFDCCTFETFQSGYPYIKQFHNGDFNWNHKMITKEGWSAVQHSCTYRYEPIPGGILYSYYPIKAGTTPRSVAFLYCTIKFYNNHGSPIWWPDADMDFMNCYINLYGSATITDVEQFKYYDQQMDSYRYNLEIIDIINTYNRVFLPTINFCNLNIIINFPNKVWLNKLQVGIGIYNSSLNVYCPNTDTCEFEGVDIGNSGAYYSGVFIHPYPLSFTASDSNIQNARKIIDITDVRVENYDELLNNPNYVLGNNNIPDDFYRLHSTNDGSFIDSEYAYHNLLQKFRYNKFIKNGLPFVPLFQFPKVSGWDINRVVSAKFRNILPTKVMFDGQEVSSLWTLNNINNIYWQGKYEPILQSQLYGNWFNNTESWNNIRKTIESTYNYLEDETEYCTIVSYVLKKYEYYNELSHLTYTYYLPIKILHFPVVEYQDNNWVALEAYKHEAENLTGILTDVDLQKLDDCIWFEIDKTMIASFNWCIVISAMIGDIDDNNEHYLFYLPLTDESGQTYVYYIKQGSYYDENIHEVVPCFVTNIYTGEHADDTIIIPYNEDLYDGCHILAINCYGILLELFVDGVIFSSTNITDYLKVQEPCKYNASIGCCLPEENVYVPGNVSYDIKNNFKGAILGLHMFADYCSYVDIWNIYTSYGQKFFKKSIPPNFVPKLLNIVTSNIPTTIEVVVGEPISYDNLLIYGQFSDGTYDIHNDITYSIPAGTVISEVGEQTLTLTYIDKPDWSYTIKLNAIQSFVARVTLLDENKEPTSTVQDFNTLAQAKTYLNNNVNNSYRLEIGNYYNQTSVPSESFQNCTSLYELIIIPTTILSISSYAFNNCTNLTKVSLNDGLKSIGFNSFSYCSIETLTVPNSVTEMQANCFAYNNNLKSVILNNGGIISGIAYCDNLEIITFTNNIVSISQINNNPKLKQINLTLGVERIYNNTFANNISLETVILPNNLQYVGSNAFSNTKYLNDFINSNDTYLINNNYLLTMKNIYDTNINIPNNITGIGADVIIVGTTIPDNSYLTLPTSLKYISSSAITITNNTTLMLLDIKSLIDTQNGWLNNYVNAINTISIGSNVTSVNYTFFENFYCDNVTLSIGNRTYKVLDNVLYSYNGKILYKVFNKSNINIVVENGTLTINRYALNLCNNADTLYIPESVTDIQTSNVTINEITIDNSYGAFSSPIGITGKFVIYTHNVSIHKVNVYSLEPIPGGTLYYENTSNAVTELKNSGNQTNRYIVYIPDKVPTNKVYSFSSVNTMVKCFISCGLTTLPRYMFQSCSNLIEVSLPNTLTALNYSAFNNCTSLQLLNIPQSVNVITYDVFQNTGITNNITTPIIIDSWLISWTDATGNIIIDESVLNIVEGVFYNNTNLISVNLNNVVNPIWANVGTTYISKPNFSDCTNLEAFYVGTDNAVYSAENGILYSKDFGSVIKSPPNLQHSITINNNTTTIKNNGLSNITNTDITITLPNVTILESSACRLSKCNFIFNKPLTTLNSSCFYNCSSLTNVVIDNNVTVIPSSCFYGTGLTTITLPTALTKLDSNAFNSCTSLTSVIVPDGATTIGPSCFSNCTSLVNVTIPPSVTSIGDKAFSNTPFLTTLQQQNSVVILNNIIVDVSTCSGAVTIPSGPTSIGSNCFKNCVDVTSIIIPNTVTYLGNNAFDGCTSLTAITIPNSVTRMGTRCFNSCTSLTSLDIPGSISIIQGPIAERCTNLSQITFHEGTTEFKNELFTNYNNSSYFCKVSEITIPNSVTTIGKYTFSKTYCPTLQTLYIDNVTGTFDTSTWNNPPTIVYLR